MDFFLKLFFRSGDWFVIVLVVLQMIGLWKMFEKSGIKGWWALIPAAREYQLGRCAGREPEGRMLSVLAALATVSEVFGIVPYAILRWNGMDSQTAGRILDVLTIALQLAMLCLAQTAVTLYVTCIVGVHYPAEGLITPWFLADIGISMFLITFASDMLSLWVSTLAHTTTTAMTIMPFVLIFQLVFSGGMLSLPAWTEPLTHFTISNPGLKVIAAQADTNNRPFVTISNMLAGMRDSEISGEITLGRVLEILTDADNPAVEQVRSIEMGGSFSGADLHDALYTSQTVLSHREDKLIDELTLGDVMDMLEAAELWGEIADVSIDARATVGEIIDLLAANPDVQAHSGDSFRFSATVGGLIDIVGEDNVKTFVEEKAAAASYKAEYALTRENVTRYWLHLLAFIVAFALLATVTLEFIDKDKR